MKSAFKILFSFFRASAIAVLAIAASIALDQSTSLSLVSEAVAQDDEPKKERETRRTPALRNKV